MAGSCNGGKGLAPPFFLSLSGLGSKKPKGFLLLGHGGWLEREGEERERETWEKESCIFLAFIKPIHSTCIYKHRVK